MSRRISRLSLSALLTLSLLSAQSSADAVRGAEDATPPALTGHFPAANSYAVALSAQPTFTLSEPVSVPADAVRLSRFGAAVAVTVSYDPTSRRVTLTPLAALRPNTSYTVGYDSSIVDAAGNRLLDGSYSFVTQLSVTLAAGSHTGYQFSRYGSGNTIIGSRQLTLSADGSLLAARRVSVTGRGVFFEVQSGRLAGYLLAETPRSYVAGIVGRTTYSPARSVAVPVGRYTGYRFSADFRTVSTTKPFTAVVPTSARADRGAVVNGTFYLHVRNGPLADHYLRATARTAARDNPPLPACKVGDVLTSPRRYADTAATLLDLWHLIPRSYSPPDLVPGANAGIRYGVYGKVRLRRLIVPDLRALNNAARAAGFGSLIVNSAYRSYATQASWWMNRVRIDGYAVAIKYTNRPGHSEHQLGTTLDINVYARRGLNAWMAANAWKFGFIKSYPANSRATTCYGAENWHYRWFGRSVASHIHQSRIVSREWLWFARH